MIRRTTPPRRLTTTTLAVLAIAGLSLTACSTGTDANAGEPPASTADDTGSGAAADSDDTATDGADAGDSGSDRDVAHVDDSGDTDDGLGAVGTLVSDEIHELSFEVDPDDYDAMIETYSSAGDKEWIEATITIDGTVYEQAGIRLKGNSSLAGLGGGFGGGRGGGGDGGRAGGLAGDASADDPSSLPWLVKLDKYVDDQNHEGLTDLVVRSNNSETALNEAVALELLQAAGLASQDAIGVAFSVNGSDDVYRLVIEHPDDIWMEEWFDASGALYKAESTGDFSYRGDDPDSYDEVFDQEAGKDNADLTPLMEFLEFINDSDDETFADELADHLDIDAFVTYLAMQELIENFDDIDGPGNNSYLYYDTESGMFTVVPWDHNLAFGGFGGFGGGPGGGRGGFPGGGFPDDGELPEGFPDPGEGGFPAPGEGGFPVPGDGEFPAPGEGGFPGDGEGGFPAPGGGGFGGGPGGRSNVLVQRFLAVDEWQELYEQRIEELRAELYDSGVADDILASWVEVVSDSGLVDDDAVASESEAIAERF